MYVYALRGWGNALSNVAWPIAMPLMRPSTAAGLYVAVTGSVRVVPLGVCSVSRLPIVRGWAVAYRSGSIAPVPSGASPEPRLGAKWEAVAIVGGDTPTTPVVLPRM